MRTKERMNTGVIKPSRVRVVIGVDARSHLEEKKGKGTQKRKKSLGEGGMNGQTRTLFLGTGEAYVCLIQGTVTLKAR